VRALIDPGSAQVVSSRAAQQVRETPQAPSTSAVEITWEEQSTSITKIPKKNCAIVSTPASP